MSGGPQGAKSGRLAIWVGGDEEIFNAHKHVLDAFSDAARFIGPIGAGSVAKLVHNCAGYGIQMVLAEVFSMGIKASICWSHAATINMLPGSTGIGILRFRPLPSIR